MTKQTGTIITVVVAVFALCCTIVFCTSGIITIASGGQYVEGIDTYVESYWGAFPCCLSILVLVVPLLCWLFLVRGKEDKVDTVVEEVIEGSIEEDFSA